MTRLRWGRLGLVALVMTFLAVTACTSGSSDSSSTTEAGGGGTTTSAQPTGTGPSPGVTDDTIKIGITYVDTAALVASGLHYDLGDHKAVYTALFDHINEEGGINGRQLEPVFAAIDPTSPAPADEACVKLTEDEDVFMVVGFFLEDAVVCPVATHETAVIGGNMTQARIDQAQAPWATWLADGDLPKTVLETMADQGHLDGKVGVFSNARDQDTLDGVVTPALDDLGITPVDNGVVTAPADDQPAVANDVQTIAERFESSGVDTVLVVGASGQDWPTNMASNSSYRPKLLFLDPTGVRAFATNAATTDTSVLEGAVAGGAYGPDPARFDESAMQDCIATLADAGIETPTPEESGDDPSNQPFQAALQACPDMAVLQAWLTAAGENLNYGTLESALDGLQVHVPGDPTERTFGPPPDADGNPAAYLFNWDEDAGDLALADDSGGGGDTGGGDSTTTTGG